MDGKPFRILGVKASREALAVEDVDPRPAALHTLSVLFRTRTPGTYEEAITFRLDDPDQPEFKLGLAAVLD